LLELRFGEMLMPKVANGIDLSWDIPRSRGQNLELELKYLGVAGWEGTLRTLGYVNLANMGSYREAIDAFKMGIDRKPDITAHRTPGNTKGGIGLNWVQSLFGVARVFSRYGWSDGQNESFAFTEVDDTFEIGFDLAGKLWHRKNDKVGFAFV